MENERHIEIISPNYTYSGSMTKQELFRVAEKHNLMADQVYIGNLVMYGWDEVDMMWEITKVMNETVIFNY